MKNNLSFILRLFALLFVFGLSKTQACTEPDKAGSIGGKTTFCAGEKETFSIPKINLASSYKWTFPAMTQIVSGANTESITVILYSSGVIRVQGINSCDTGISSTLSITVNQLPKLSLFSKQKYCCDYGNIALGSSQFGSPTGGTWSCRQNSNYVVSNAFQTTAACDSKKSQTYSMYYSYQDPTTSCVNIDSTYITINPLPALIFKNGSYCQNLIDVPLQSQIKAPINLNSMQNVNWRVLKSLQKPSGGFLKTNELIYDNDPSLNINYRLKVDTGTIDLGNSLKDSLIIEVTIQDASGCYNRDTATVYIIKAPAISVNSLTELCINAGFVNLTMISNAKPQKGCWSVINQSGYSDSANLSGGLKSCDTLNTFFLKLQNGPGLYRMKYILNTDGCLSEMTTDLRIYPRPNITIGLSPNSDNGKYCENEGDIKLNGNPTGGVWSCNVNGAVSGTIFKPYAVDSAHRDRSILLTYSYQHPKTGCDTTKSLFVFVQSKPRIRILTSNIDTCQQGSMQFLLTAKYAFTSKISWVQSFDPIKASFENKEQLSNKNPVLFTIQPNKDTVTNVTITAFTEAEGVCPFSDHRMNIRIDTLDCIKNSLQIIQHKQNFSSELKLYPNPNTGSFTIELSKRGNYSIKVYSMVGELILEQGVENFQTKTLNHSFSQGNYLLVIEDENGKLMHQRMMVD
jgi:hypothetical protein